jgi:translation initiation factor 3 subunit E
VLRYLAAAAILSRKAATGFTPAVACAPAQAVSARVRHAIKELYVEFDFEQALKEAAEGVRANDFFLGKFKDEFLDCARFLVSKAYVRIHGRVDIE